VPLSSSSSPTPATAQPLPLRAQGVNARTRSCVTCRRATPSTPPRAPVRASLLPLRRHMPSLATILLAASRYRRRDAASATPPHAAACVLSQRAWAACSVGRRGHGLHAHAEHGSCSAPCEQATGTVRMGRRQGIGPCLSLFSYFLNLIKSMQIQNFVQVWFELRKCEINFLE
jgi:hypothetical protein